MNKKLLIYIIGLAFGTGLLGFGLGRASVLIPNNCYEVEVV